jgi:hypothetical protein
MNVGKKLKVRKCLTSLKKPFHFLDGLIFLPISTAHGCQGSYDGVSPVNICWLKDETNKKRSCDVD